MLNLNKTLLLLILLLFFMSSCDKDESDSNPLDPGNRSANCKVTGTVKEYSTNRPVPNALIESDDGYSTRSDAEGAYELWISPGNRIISVEATGYASVTENVTGSDSSTVNLNFTLRPIVEPATISGRVSDHNSGNAISGATVSAQDGTSTTTDGNGNYSLQVAAGVVRITVSASGYNTASNQISTAEGRQYTLNFTLIPETSGNLDEDLIGNWLLTGLKLDDYTIPSDQIPYFTMTFNADGTGNMYTEGERRYFDWTADGSVMTLNGNPINYTVSRTTLRFSLIENDIIYGYTFTRR